MEWMFFLIAYIPIYFISVYVLHEHFDGFEPLGLIPIINTFFFIGVLCFEIHDELSYQYNEMKERRKERKEERIRLENDFETSNYEQYIEE